MEGEPALTSEASTGRRIAALLAGSWRESAGGEEAPPPPAPDVIADDLDAMLAVLIRGGGGALAWWRIRETPLAGTRAAAGLRDVFRIQTLDHRLHEERIVRVVQVLAEVGVRPVLAKGWAVARRYPRPGLRPYGDIDLYVSPHEFGTAAEALAAHPDTSARVDLHAGLDHGGGLWAEVAARSAGVEVGEASVRVMSATDHLWFLSTHLLFHGAWRPVWLTDIAVLVERGGADIDWKVIAALPRRLRTETRVAVRLAHELLGADISPTPWAGEAHALPRWLPRATLAAWTRTHYSTTTSILLTPAEPGALWRSLRLRWPNPIEVTHRWRAPYNRWPRFPLQVWDLVVRGVRAAAALPAALPRRRAARHPTGSRDTLHEARRDPDPAA